jgi:hypothetical protein
VSILKNAIDSIAIGLEDFSSPDERRVISCARNIFAGILLLFKYKLSLLSTPDSDEALIKQRVSPVIDDNENIVWKGQGKKTVDVQSIKQRFESLLIEVDWKRIKKINDFRNDIEHYYSNLSHDSIRSLISDSFIIISDFIHSHIDADPKDLLGAEAWSVMIEVSEVYEKEKIECESALEKLEYFGIDILNAFQDFSCEECGSGLIAPTLSEGDAVESNFICKSCDNNLPYESIINSALFKYYEYEVYLSHTDGNDIPIIECPECDGIYLYEEGVCSLCGHTAEHTCQRCGMTISPEELSSEPYCGWCFHMMSKDD